MCLVYYAKVTYDETQQVIENGDWLGNNPRDNPHANADGHPGADREEATAVHLIGSTEKAHVDVFACNVAQHDTWKNSLFKLAEERGKQNMGG